MVESNGAENFPPFSVKFAYAGTIVYPPGGKHGPRMQNDLQLVLVHTGAMNVWIDGRRYDVPPGNVSLHKPGHHEEFHFAVEEETWHRWITITVETLSEQQQLNELEALPFYIPISDKMNQLTDLMLAIHRQHGSDDDIVVRSLGQAAICLYIAECGNEGGEKRTHSAVLKAKAVIQHRFHENLSLKQLAEEGYVTPEHLIRLFRRHEEMTPSQYLWSYRIERGLELLRSSGLSIGEIAEQTGFKTSHHFARSIKKKTGLTPSEIRKKAWVLL